jgi:hypothetical protein
VECTTEGRRKRRFECFTISSPNGLNSFFGAYTDQLCNSAKTGLWKTWKSIVRIIGERNFQHRAIWQRDFEQRIIRNGHLQQRIIGELNFQHRSIWQRDFEQWK